MAHEILAVKLCQLDSRVEQLHSRICMSETANHAQLRQQIDLLKRECAESEAAMQSNLQHSKAALASILARNYSQAGQIIAALKDQLQALASASPDGQTVVEEKILLAEYALDFAQQAADRALLLALEAIDAQLLQQQEEGE